MGIWPRCTYARHIPEFYWIVSKAARQDQNAFGIDPLTFGAHPGTSDSDIDRASSSFTFPAHVKMRPRGWPLDADVPTAHSPGWLASCESLGLKHPQAITLL
jgi:hypothetical protein